MTTHVGRRLLAITTAALMVFGLVFVLAESASAGAQAFPVLLQGASNDGKRCVNNQGDGQTWIEFKLEVEADVGQGNLLTNGDHTDGTLMVTISNLTDTSFTWTSNIGVDAVIVKDGVDGANLYIYDPPTESFGDTNTAPSEKDISNIRFCYDVKDTPGPSSSTSSSSSTTEATTTTTTDGTTTTTTDGTTTTTTDGTTTTTGGTTTTTGGTTTTTAGETTTTEHSTTTTADERTTTTTTSTSTSTSEATTTQPTDTVSPTSIVNTTAADVSVETLPFTGADSGPVAALALVLMAGGALALVGARVFRAGTDE